MSRPLPLLIGLHNPLSPVPSHALLPWPQSGNGARLLSILQEVDPSFTEDEYLAAFERTNLWRGQQLPSGPVAKRMLDSEGRKLLARCTHPPRDVVLFGPRVWAYVLGRTPPPLFEWQSKGGSAFVMLPHPSLRNFTLNDSSRRRRMGEVLLALARPSTRKRRQTP